MNFQKLFILASLSLCLSIVTIACGGSDGGSEGVISIDTPTPVIIAEESDQDSIDNPPKTDEEITTEFTTCLRG